jgi:nicotinamidase-related amidase
MTMAAYPRGSYGPGRSIDVNVEKPAVIILDMAKGYGWEPGSYGYDMVARVRKLKDAAHTAGVQVVHVHSLRRPTDHLPFPELNSRMMVGTEGLDVIPELQPMDGDIQIYKRYLGGFTQNDLDYTLRTMGCDCVILAGASTDNCVIWTAADAFQLRYKVVVVEDCTMTHSQARAEAGAKEAALMIIRTVLQSEVSPLDTVVEKYLQPR